MLTWRLDYVAFCAAVVAILLAVEWWLRRRPRVGGLGVIFWCFLAAMLAIGAGPVEFFGDRERDRRHDMLMGIAPTYAREMESLGHARLPSACTPDDPLYLSLIEAEIRWLKANPNVSDIYTFRKDGERILLIVDSETDYDRSGAYDAEREQRTEIGKEYPEATEGILAAFDGVPSFDSEPYTDEWGTWVSALEPMFGPDGKVEAVLGVDYPAAAWIGASLVARLCAMGGILLVFSIGTSATIVVRMQRAALAERLEVESELRIARDAAESANVAKSAFLANMSHEIRTPMTAILGYTELLNEPGLTDESRDEHIGTIRHNGEHLLTIINDILDLSKIETGNMTFELGDCSPVEIAGEVAALLRVRAAAKGLELRIVPEYPLPACIRTDGHRLRQVLVNLVGNAIKFTERGSVTVGIAWREGGPITFTVTDTGIGMSSATIAALFRPFSQGDASMSRRFGGTGLGLTISKRMAEGLGGTIAVCSEPGKGSTFILSVPAGAGAMMSEAPRPQERRPAAPTPTQVQARVLLAEDGPDNQRLFLHHLTRAGAEVRIADSGEAALAALASETFDVVFMDMQMPGIDGYTATAMARARGVTAPIIALTAHAMSGDREKCLKAGCNDYLSKPIDRAALLHTCAKWVASGPVRAAA